ncbi:MAG: hypothetical protein HC802_21590 [Caldilineaceae bacterium]|nr:hypothetical protein [Caldilineaceae bacterium]
MIETPSRVQDYALLIGHAWRCIDCRTALLNEPEKVWIGYKLDERQRACILAIEDTSFHTVMELSEATGLTSAELDAAIEHPRARLRHLGSTKGDYLRNGNR